MKTRFAPSPTGFMHLGNIYSALQCEKWADGNSAQLILRIEDIDFTRCKPGFSAAILDDLNWLGLKFDEKTTYQSQRLPLYQQALDKLVAMDVLYPCFCTRKQIQNVGIEGNALDNYPKLCFGMNKELQQCRMQEEAFSWRLNSKEVKKRLGNELFWLDGKLDRQYFNLEDIGDVIIGRKDIKFSYHLSVVVDDAEQVISHVIRGDDLKRSTPVHRVLQILLHFESPLYTHHSLIEDKQGVRLAKSKQSVPMRQLRDKGWTSEEVKTYLLQTNKS